MSEYLWSFLLYMDRDTEIRSTYSTPNQQKLSISMQITSSLLGKGYTVCLDNYNNSPALAVFLKRCTTVCIGTLRLNRKIDL
jgi:hypothetical protein